MNSIFPSILSTDFFNLKSRLEEFEKHHIEFIHLDIMDGHFVDNISFGPSMAAAIRSEFNFKFDSHLMVSRPETVIPKFIQAGSDWISFHIEALGDIQENLSFLRENNVKAGLVLNPDTKVESVFKYLPGLHYVLLMSVYPGYGGQKFIMPVIEKVRALKEKINEEGLKCLIQVDGGINHSNINLLRSAGADLFVVGTYLFNSNDIEKTLRELN